LAGFVNLTCALNRQRQKLSRAAQTVNRECGTKSVIGVGDLGHVENII
jgi:hypothetical protein